MAAAPLDDVYYLGPDSAPQPGVPQGSVTAWTQLPSHAYPGTLHDYCVYVPAQYDAAHPAALMIFQDGQAFKDRDAGLRTPAHGLTLHLGGLGQGAKRDKAGIGAPVV